MGFFRALGRALWRFMVIFSFIVNIILVVVLVVAVALIFEIKNEIAEPLVEGLHSSFVGLDQATIDWTIPVRDQIQVELDIPLETNTVVILQEPVPLNVNALIDLPGINAFNVNATVDLELPVGLELPVSLDLDVAVDEPLDIALDVRAVIPLAETQLHDVAQNLRLQLEPIAIALNNLPNDFGGAVDLAGDVLSGDADLLAPNDYSENPWPGFSTTAGVGYTLFDEEVPADNLPLETGIVPVGGIPLLDEQIRAEIYEQGGPEAINQAARDQLDALGIESPFWRDGVGPLARPEGSLPTLFEAQAAEPVAPVQPGLPPVDDQGIIQPETTPIPPTATLIPVSPTPIPTMTPIPTITPTPVPDQGIIDPGG